MKYRIGDIVKSVDRSKTSYGKIGIVVGLYGSRLAYSSDYCAIFPRENGFGSKYVRHTFNENQLSDVRELSSEEHRDVLDLRDRVLIKLNIEKTGDKMFKAPKFLILNMDRDITAQLGMSNNSCDTHEEAVERCKQFIVKYPSSSFYIFEAKTLVKPKAECDIVPLTNQLSAPASGT